MATLTGRVLFTVGAQSFTWEDVVVAACAWGDWPALEARVQDGLACVGRLDELDDGDEDGLDEAEVEAATEAFRYERDLIAAADLDAWLDARGLTLDALLDFVQRTVLRERWRDRLDEIREEYEVDAVEAAEAILAEAICSGLAARVCQRLAARAAMYAHGGPEAAGAEPLVDAQAAEAVARALPDLEPEVRRARLAAVARLDTAWRRFTAQAHAAEAIRAIVVARHLDWMRLTVERVVAADGDVAREIALCVREDGRPLGEVAADAGLATVRDEVWLEELDPALRPALAGARAGEVIGPVTITDGHVVVVVHAKRLASEHDAAVLARAEQALLARTVEREVAGRVTWHATL